MSKAVLVMDMPKSCKECPAGNSMISDKEDELCACELIFPFLDEVRCVDKYISSRPDWCPLRELPEKKEIAEHSERYTDVYNEGWNGYRDAIMGEECEEKT